MADETSAAIGARLRESRLAARLTQQDVASDFLRTRQAISSWEAGNTLPSLREFRELVALYGVSSDRVLFGADIEDESRAALGRMREVPRDFADSVY